MTARVRQTILAALMSRHEDAEHDDEIEPAMSVAQLSRATGIGSRAITGALMSLRRDGRVERVSWGEGWAFVPVGEAKEVTER